MSAETEMDPREAMEEDIRTLAPKAYEIEENGFTCRECEGEGGRMVETHATAPVGSPPLVGEPCEGCGGSGRQRCSSCGEEQAVVWLTMGANEPEEMLCPMCLSMAVSNKLDEEDEARAWSERAARRKERARKLRLFATLLDTEGADLDSTVTPCECCGLNVQGNRDEYQWALSLAALTKKLRRIAADMDGTTTST